MPNPKITNGADLIATRLAGAGIRHAFGIPGGEVLALVEAFGAAGIEPILVKHENAAGFMAEGVWHATGKPGLFYATLGPGVANAVNVVANAQQDRVPLIFVTGCVDAAEAESYTHQVFDHQALLRPVVKASFRATAQTCEAVVDKALAVALSGRPGPVHIDLPIGVAEGPAVAASKPVMPTTLPARPAEGVGLEAARAALAAAKKPLVVAGLDIVNQGAADALASFARAWGTPVITSYKAKGVLPEHDPLALGGAGLSPKADRHLLPLVQAADVVVLAGYDPIEMRINWREPFAAETVVIDLVAEALPHGMHRRDHLIVGDVAAGLAALGTPSEPREPWPGGEPAAARAALQAAFAPTAPWGPDVVFAAVRAATPPDTVITIDSGAHRILLSQLWQAPIPRAVLQSTGLCTMGCAVPLALGYKLASPATPVVAFVGDAGLEMGLGELATARDLGLPVVIIVLVDRSLALIEMKQRATQRPNAAVDFSGSDFPAVAQALGGTGRWIDDASTLAAEVEAALGRDGFTVLACRIDRRAYDGKI
jgi:acetolactate synthase-1/2/3 large subunit